MSTNNSKHANAATKANLPENVVEYAARLDREIEEQGRRIARLKSVTEQYEGAFVHGNDTSGMLGIVAANLASVQSGAVAIETARDALKTMASALNKGRAFRDALRAEES